MGKVRGREGGISGGSVNLGNVLRILWWFINRLSLFFSRSSFRTIMVFLRLENGPLIGFFSFFNRVSRFITPIFQVFVPTGRSFTFRVYRRANRTNFIFNDPFYRDLLNSPLFTPRATRSLWRFRNGPYVKIP